MSIDGMVDIQAEAETHRESVDSAFEFVETEPVAVVQADHNCHLKVKC
jgi:hypothetical protein